MKFTDDDLKRLKEHMVPHWPWSLLYKPRSELVALLARLEAAEIICQRWDDDYYYEDGGLIMDWVYDDLKRWRKTCGKFAERT